MSKLLKLYPTFIVASSLLPLAAGAQIDTIIKDLGSTLQNIVGLLFILATIIFLWGVIQFITKAGDEVARNKAKGIMTWGIVGLAIMAAAWGVVTILVQYFKVGGGTIPTSIPTTR